MLTSSRFGVRFAQPMASRPAITGESLVEAHYTLRSEIADRADRTEVELP